MNKAEIVENVQQIIKERMQRYFTKMNTFKYIDILADLANSYNRSYHRTINKTPLEMLSRFIISNKKLKINYDVNTKVSLSRSTDKFKKRYITNWSQEVLQVCKVKDFPSDWLKLYYLKDLEVAFVQREKQDIF